MSPTLPGVVEEEGQSNVTLLASPTSAESVCRNGLELKERNYMGLSDCSFVESSTVSAASDKRKTSLNLKATELQFGLPGSQSPKRNPEPYLLSSTQLGEKPFFPLHPANDGHYSSTQKNVVLGNKRGFCDAMDGFSQLTTTTQETFDFNFRDEDEFNFLMVSKKL